MTDLTNLKGILTAIRNKEIDYGMNKEYCFVTDHDGELVFLQRDDENSAHQKDLDKYEEVRGHWPENGYDGKVIWSAETGLSRGLHITEEFLNALDVEFLG